jgi:hypothetical protein
MRAVTPVLRVAVLHPEDARGDIGRHMLDGRHLGDVAVLVAEDLDRVGGPRRARCLIHNIVTQVATQT